MNIAATTPYGASAPTVWRETEVKSFIQPRSLTMSYRLFVSMGVAALACAASPIAMAAGDGFRALDNEAGTEFVGTVGNMSREEVKHELEEARRDGWQRLTEASPSPTPSALRAGFTSTAEQVRQATALHEQALPSNGWRDFGGEAGWTFVGP
jgi:hypothetical protein